MAFDVPTTKDVYSSFSDGWIYLNAGQCTQVPERIQAATISAFRNAWKSLPGETGAGTHGQSRSSGISAAAELTTSVHRVFTDLTGGSITGVVLGFSREALMEQFTSVTSRRLTLGSNLVISRIGSQVIHAPLRRAANLYGAQVWIAKADLPSDTLPPWQLNEFVDEHARLVVAPAASPFVGTIAPVADISRQVHEYSNAQVLVDAPDIVAHLDVSMSKLDTDTMLVNTSVLGGPETAALVFRDSEMLERVTSLSYVPNACDVEQTEVSSVSPALFGGVSESVLRPASLDSMARGPRRYHIETAMPQVFRCLTTLSERLITVLMTLPRVCIIDMDTEDDPSANVPRTQHIPRVSFLVDGVSAKVVVDRLPDNGLATSIVDAYESPLLKAAGINEAGGTVGVDLQPFNTPHDINQLVYAATLFGQLGS